MNWEPAGEWQDIRYAVAGTDNGAIAKITINRPEVRNAFRPTTVREMATAFELARDDPEVGVIILTGEGPLAFCSGGDQKVRGDDGYVDEKGIGRLNILDVQVQIRRLPKPVIAMVAGYAIGGGHVLHLVCDLTVAADNARFGQTGPRVGSFDGGYGAGLLARTVGRRRPRRSGSCASSTTPPRRWRWAWSTRSCRSTGWRRRRWPGARGSSTHSPLRCACSRPGSTPTPTAWPASSSWPATPPSSTTSPRRPRRAGTPTWRSASPTSGVPQRP